MELLNFVIDMRGRTIAALAVTMLLGACGTSSLKEKDMESDSIGKGVSVPKATTELCRDVCDGLVAYYPFFGNARDTSGNSLDGLVKGATLTTDRDGNANRAYQFNGKTFDNGTTTHIELPLSSLTQNLEQSDYSLVAWVKPESDPPGSLDNWYAYGMIHSYSSIHDYGLRYHWSNCFEMGNPVFYDNQTEISWGGASACQKDFNQYYHVVGVGDSTNDNTKIYVNGKLEHTRTWENSGKPDPSKVNKKWFIGSMNPTSVTSPLTMEGVIDEIRMYNRTLTALEIETIYRGTAGDNATPEMRKTTATCSRVCDGLVLYMPMIDNTTDVNTDTFGNTIDNNTLSVSTDNSSNTPTLASDRDSNDNASYRFDGTDDFLQVDNVSSIALESGSFTISMIAKLNNLSQDWITYSGGQYAKNTLFGTNSVSIELGYHAYPGSGSGLTHNLNFGVWNGNSWTQMFISTTNPLSYQNIVAVADRIQGVLMLYVDGALVSGESWDKTISSSSNWKLGMQATTAWEEKNRGNLDGWIDEVRVYNRALSADEVRALYSY
jgi:hypothetical protein